MYKFKFFFLKILKIGLIMRAGLEDGEKGEKGA